MRRAVVVLFLCAACPTRDIAEQDPLPSNSTYDVIPITPRRDVDILFVVDNSTSMEGEQNSLTRNFPEFMRVLGNIEGGLPNVHIGVVSSNVGAGDLNECQNGGDNGMLLVGGGDACGAPAEHFLSDIKLDDGTRMRNYSGSLEEKFACMAKLGTRGCGLEMHLESMIKAVDGRNPGFLRDNAYLAIIILADEDDCSNQDGTLFAGMTGAPPNVRYQCILQGLECELGPLPPSGAEADYGTCKPAEDTVILHPREYLTQLRKIKPRANDLLVSVIAGPEAPLHVNVDGDDHTPRKTCGVIMGNGSAGAAPAYRLSELVRLVGPEHASFHSICGDENPPVPEPDLTPALTQIAELLAIQLTNKCLSASTDLTDVLPSAPGVQPECTVVDALKEGYPDETRTVVGRCPIKGDGTPDRTTLPCWWLVADNTCDASTSRQRIQVERAGMPPKELSLIIDCAAR